MISNKKQSTLLICGMAIGLASIGCLVNANAADRAQNSVINNVSVHNSSTNQFTSLNPRTHIVGNSPIKHRYHTNIFNSAEVNDQAPDPSLVAMLSASGMLGILCRRRTVRKQIQV